MPLRWRPVQGASRRWPEHRTALHLLALCHARGHRRLGAGGGFQVEKGTELLTLYQFNTMVAEHWFCSVCGIYTHHRRRSRPTEFGINVACIDGLSPFDFAEVVVNDGQTHPNDRPPGTDGITGILRFDPR